MPQKPGPTEVGKVNCAQLKRVDRFIQSHCSTTIAFDPAIRDFHLIFSDQLNDRHSL